MLIQKTDHGFVFTLKNASVSTKDRVWTCSVCTPNETVCAHVEYIYELLHASLRLCPNKTISSMLHARIEQFYDAYCKLGNKQCVICLEEIESPFSIYECSRCTTVVHMECMMQYWDFEPIHFLQCLICFASLK